MKRKINLIVSLGLVLSISLSSCSSGGASSKEKAVKKFAEAHMKADIDGMCSMAVPEKLWDYVCEESGLSSERLFYKITYSSEDEFAESADNWKKRVKEEKIEFVIEKGYDREDDSYTWINKAMKNAGIDDKVEEYQYVDTNYSDGYIYEINGSWYYAPEWFLPSILTIVNDGYDEWNDD